jgi:ferredoxin
MPLTHRGREILSRVPGASLQSTVGVGCEIVRHEELCVGCGTCARNCPSGASERGGSFDVTSSWTRLKAAAAATSVRRCGA